MGSDMNQELCELSDNLDILSSQMDRNETAVKDLMKNLSKMEDDILMLSNTVRTLTSTVESQKEEVKEVTDFLHEFVQDLDVKKLSLLGLVKYALNMAVSGAEKDTCLICTDAMKDPKKLPCGHVICRQCVVSLINKRSRKCPFCRERLTYTVSQLKE